MQGLDSACAASPAPDALYTLTDAGAYDLFTNYVDGYSLHVEKGMQVDMTFSSVRAVLENEDKRIEIYKQDVAAVGRATYINYSNQFLENDTDHFLYSNRSQWIRGRYVTATVWSRNKLARVENDRNHYVCLEIPAGWDVYTVFVKSRDPASASTGYAYLARNFSTFAPLVAARDSVSHAVDVEKRGWSGETTAFYERSFCENAPLVWGVFEPVSNWGSYTRIDYYERYFEYEFPIILNYSDFKHRPGQPGLRERLENAHMRGKTLQLTLQTNNGDGGGNMVYAILNGEYDEFLQDYADTIADFGQPVLFRPGNEMNGDWTPYSSFHTSKDTEVFKAFYRYIYGIFENAGANNVIWVWNPNGKSYPDFKWNNELMYYPGDAYVDVIGMTMYNTGTFYSSTGERWKEFRDLYDDLYARYSMLFGQPLMITEFASASMGGDKEAWVERMFADIQQYERIKIAVWWDHCDFDAAGNVSRSYIIEETPELMQIFRRNLSVAERSCPCHQ